MGPSLLEIAEAPAAYLAHPHPSVVVADGYVASQRRPGLGIVQRVRLAPERIEDARAEVRALAAERGWSSVDWWTTDLTRPTDLGARLGLEVSERLEALALTDAPSGRGEAEVRRVETFEDFASVKLFEAELHGLPSPPPDRLRETWEAARHRTMLWLAVDGGRVLGMGRAAASPYGLVLVGGATRPDARGRGVYRSLVAARWDEAVRLGTPALVTTANGRSAPILRRLGFERLGEVRIHADER